MNTRKLCGFDVNGWRDFSARNWLSQPGEDDVLGRRVFSECGPLSSVVHVGEAPQDGWIGGRQADVAPHGLGVGWGEIGRPERRAQVTEILIDPEKHASQLQAAFKGLGRGAAVNIVAIPDAHDMTEARQDGILSALNAARFQKCLLVWRPVLAAIYAIDAGILTEEQTVAVLCHEANGLSVQKLRIRRTQGKSGSLMAPERRRVASPVNGDMGYAHLLQAARKHVLDFQDASPRTQHLLLSRSVARAALGLSVQPEILRHQNGGWDIVDLLEQSAWPDTPLSSSLPDLGDCAAVLFETLLEGDLRRSLQDWLAHSVTPPVTVLPARAVAQAALVAARRFGDGDPVYFDFLPRLSTIVFRQSKPGNFDLIDDTETLEAGRIYRSPQPAEFAIPSGHSTVSVFLRKEAEPHPKKASIDLGAPLLEPSPVSLWVEQKPAAGRAKIVMEAPGLGRQFMIDWDKAEEDPRPWDDIIASLEVPPPSIPARLVLKCGMYPWDGGGGSGLMSTLDRTAKDGAVDWEIMARHLTARPFGEYCISSDGEVPARVEAKYLSMLDTLTETALAFNRQRLSQGQAAIRDNASLQFLTWQFRRCPEEVTDWLVDCIENCSGRAPRPPFVQHSASWVLVFQGLARIARGASMERRIIHALMLSDLRTWNWRVESACMAILLSRSDTAPLALGREDVAKLVQRNITDFKSALGSQYTTFNYAPFLLGGLLRWRLKVPQALLLGKDPLADELYDTIGAVQRDLELRKGGTDAFKRKRSTYLPILQSLKSELSGKGGNPDLLLDIYNA